MKLIRRLLSLILISLFFIFVIADEPSDTTHIKKKKVVKQKAEKIETLVKKSDEHIHKLDSLIKAKKK